MNNANDKEYTMARTNLNLYFEAPKAKDTCDICNHEGIETINKNGWAFCSSCTFEGMPDRPEVVLHYAQLYNHKW